MKNYIVEKIEQAKRSGATELNLQSKQIDIFPDMVCQLTQLKTLLLGSYNVVQPYNITYDEDYWWEVTVDDNHISSLPDNIHLLRNLEVLNLNQLGLMKLSESIGKLTNLKELYLRNNFLNYLPKSISRLQNLEKLDISFNSFKTIPPQIFECKNLKELNVGANRIKVIPFEIAELKNLKKFDFSNYNYKKVWELVIEEFDLNINNISDIPESMATMTKLKEINFQWNPLEIALKYFLRDMLSVGLSKWFGNKDRLREKWKDEPDEECMC